MIIDQFFNCINKQILIIRFYELQYLGLKKKKLQDSSVREIRVYRFDRTDEKRHERIYYSTDNNIRTMNSLTETIVFVVVLYRSKKDTWAKVVRKKNSPANIPYVREDYSHLHVVLVYVFCAFSSSCLAFGATAWRIVTRPITWKLTYMKYRSPYTSADSFYLLRF